MTNSNGFTFLKFLLITSSIAAIIYFGVALRADNNSASPLQLDGEHNANEASQVSPIQLARDSHRLDAPLLKNCHNIQGKWKTAQSAQQPKNGARPTKKEEINNITI